MMRPGKNAGGGQLFSSQLLVLVMVLLSSAMTLAQDPGWPRQITKPGGKVVLYQPQVDDWKNYQQVDARMAFTVTLTGGQSHVGVVTVRLKSAVNMDDHTVFLSDPQVTSISFPSLDAGTTAKMDQLMRTFLNPAATMTISLERLAASVKKTKTPPVTSVKNDPPEIMISLRPAILLMVNGTAVTAPIANSNLQFIVNSNFPLFLEQSSSNYYLFDGKGWHTSKSVQGPWTATGQLPKQMSKVSENQNFADLKAYIPASAGAVATAPQIYYSATPAELVVFKGRPEWTAIPGTQLSYGSNTDSPVFKYTPTGAFYYLTSGRWFTSTTPLRGPWTFATYSLPPDFAKIPSGSPAGGVLASVPGTPEAEDAVLIAQIPTTVTVNAAEAAKEVQVSYAGAPQFVPIAGTTMLYATNTPNKVIQLGAQYYLCYQGVWFVGSTPQGPWQVAQTVPSVIYTIPPSSPVYNVTYVTQVYSSGTVQASYTAGYMGAFIMGATVGAIVCSGTGYYYPPYIYHGYYYPYAATYGYHTYNSYTGAYGYGGAAYGPYGSAHWGTSYNPNTGTYARGASASNAYGYRAAGQAYNPYTGAYGATRQGGNAYGSWGQSVVSKNGNTAYTQHASNAYGSVGTVQTSQGGKGAATSTAYGNTAAGKTSNGDMYAGHDGNVYKNTGSGWQTYNNGSWNDVNKPTQQQAQQKTQSYSQQHPTSGTGSYSAQQKPTGSTSDLNQEAQARQRGATESQRYSQGQHSGWGDRSGGGGGRSFGGRR
jgi:hypothetical protein